MSELKKIGYVEDEQTLQQIAQMSLERVGKFEVQTYSSCEEALADLPENTPDLLLLDVSMPGMKGTELIVELKNHDSTKALPVIFMTGRTKEEDIKELYDLGALEVLIKPIDVMKLPTKLREIWGTRS